MWTYEKLPLGVDYTEKTSYLFQTFQTPNSRYLKWNFFCISQAKTRVNAIHCYIETDKAAFSFSEYTIKYTSYDKPVCDYWCLQERF